MTIVILIMPETLYMPDQDIESQMANDDEETHKPYVRLMDLRSFVLVSKLIEIIDHTLKSENWTK